MHRGSSSPAEQVAERSAPARRPLEGKVGVVTGGARGLGRAYVHRLAALGANVAVVDRNLRSFEEFEGEADGMFAGTSVDEAELFGVGAIGIEADVTDRAAMEHMARQILERFGRLDIAVCNAGGGSGSASENQASTMDPEQFETVLDRNLKGTIHTCAAVVPTMKQQRYGKIVTTTSILGIAPRKDGGYAHYSVAKAGVVMYTRALAAEVATHGITVNAIAPGVIATGRALKIMPDDLRHEYETSVPMGRLGTPEDCANVVEFLTSDLSSYVTGHVVPCDGGTVS